jgi:hypothetical protein
MARARPYLALGGVVVLTVVAVAWPGRSGGVQLQ